MMSRSVDDLSANRAALSTQPHELCLEFLFFLFLGRGDLFRFSIACIFLADCTIDVPQLLVRFLYYTRIVMAGG